VAFCFNREHPVHFVNLRSSPFSHLICHIYSMLFLICSRSFPRLTSNMTAYARGGGCVAACLPDHCLTTSAFTAFSILSLSCPTTLLPLVRFHLSCSKCGAECLAQFSTSCSGRSFNKPLHSPKTSQNCTMISRYRYTASTSKIFPNAIHLDIRSYISRSWARDNIYPQPLRV